MRAKDCFICFIYVPKPAIRQQRWLRAVLSMLYPCTSLRLSILGKTWIAAMARALNCSAPRCLITLQFGTAGWESVGRACQWSWAWQGSNVSMALSFWVTSCLLRFLPPFYMLPSGHPETCLQLTNILTSEIQNTCNCQVPIACYT